MFIPKQSSPLTKLRREGHAEERRRFWAATARGVMVVGLVLILLGVAYETALHLLQDLKVHLGYEE